MTSAIDSAQKLRLSDHADCVLTAKLFPQAHLLCKAHFSSWAHWQLKDEADRLIWFDRFDMTIGPVSAVGIE